MDIRRNFTKMRNPKRILLPKILLFALTLMMVTAAHGQEKQKSVEKQRDEFLKLQEERDEGAAKHKEADIKKHRDIQTKDVQKRMKKSKKKSVRLQKKKHEDNFFQRLFTKKPKRR